MEEIERTLIAFSEAAQDWGWQNDQGTRDGPARAHAAYEAALKAHRASIRTAIDAAGGPGVPEELRKLSERQDPDAGEWFVEHAYTDDGLSAIVDGRSHGMFPVKGEMFEIELACAAVNYVRSKIPAAPAPNQYGGTL